MNVFNPQQLTDIIYEAPERTNQTVKKVARRMGGISPKYLAKQLNPDDPSSKLGIEDFVYLSAVTDLAALDYIEGIFGRVAMPLPQDAPPNKKRWLSHISAITKEVGESVCILADALASDDKIDSKEAGEISAEVYEALQALSALWLELKHQKPNKEL